MVAILLPVGFVVWLVQPAPAERTSGDPAAPSEIGEVSTEVSVATVERVDLSLFAEATGYLRPWRQVEVKTEIGGKVVQRLVEEGQHVATGAPFLRLFDEDKRIELAEAQADLLQVRARYAVFVDAERGQRADPLPEQPQPTPERPDPTPTAECLDPSGVECGRIGRSEVEAAAREAQELFEQGLISREALLEAQRNLDATRMLGGEYRADVQAATTGLTQAELRTQRAQLALSRTELRAPFSGRIADLGCEVGQQLSTGETCLQLLDESRVTVDVDVLEADIVWLRPGAEARVQVPSLGPDWLHGTVTSINPQVDSEHGTGRARVLLDNPDGSLMPGLFAFVRVEIRRLEDRLVVPEAAVILRQGRELVFRLEGDRAVWAYVTTGERSGDLVEIKDGLDEFEEVAVAGHFALAHESKVTIAERLSIDNDSGSSEPWKAGSAP